MSILTVVGSPMAVVQKTPMMGYIENRIQSNLSHGYSPLGMEAIRQSPGGAQSRAETQCRLDRGPTYSAFWFHSPPLNPNCGSWLLTHRTLPRKELHLVEEDDRSRLDVVGLSTTHSVSCWSWLLDRVCIFSTVLVLLIEIGGGQVWGSKLPVGFMCLCWGPRGWTKGFHLPPIQRLGFETAVKVPTLFEPLELVPDSPQTTGLGSGGLHRPHWQWQHDLKGSDWEEWPVWSEPEHRSVLGLLCKLKFVRN